MQLPVLRFEAGPRAAPDGRPGSVWRDADGQMHGRARIGRAARWLDWDGLATFAFGAGSPVVRVWPAAGVAPADVRAVFDRTIRPIVLQGMGWQALHASAARGPAGVLAFCGLSGSGKSTLAWAMARQPDHVHYADDSLVWRPEDGRPIATALPFTPSLRAASQEHFSREDVGPAPLVTPLLSRDPIRAVFVLRQDARCPSPVLVQPVDPERAFATLLPHAHCFDCEDPDETRRLAEAYLSLAASAGVFVVVYRPDFSAIAGLVRAVTAAAGDR